MNSIEIAVVALIIIFGGTLLGMYIGRRVPHHLTPETRSVVTASMAVVGTMTALVIGLLISSANSSFSARNEALTRMSADVVRLDGLLRRYGPETDGIRTSLQRYTAMKTDELFGHVGEPASETEEPASTVVLYEVQDRILMLHPSDDDRRWLAAQALQIAGDLSDARWTIIQQNLSSVPLPFLALVVMWLTALFLSFGLFAPSNSTAIVSPFVCVLAISAAFKVVLDMDTPFGGPVHVSGFPLRLSSEPMRHALDVIKR
jgi:hypothetical protein